MKMNKMKGMAWVLLLAAAPALAAQGRSPTDTGRANRMQRWQNRIRTEMGLTDDQAAKLRATQEKFGPQRRDVMQRARAIHKGLRSQLQPGVAANSDSVRKLLDARSQVRLALAQLDGAEDRELAAYLTPVQRARLEMRREHMMMRRRMHGGYGRGMMRGQGGEVRPGNEAQGDQESVDEGMGDQGMGDMGDDDDDGPDPEE
jgi:Spy/CpxP family protein refolding chaperone